MLTFVDRTILEAYSYISKKKTPNMSLQFQINFHYGINNEFDKIKINFTTDII